MKITEKLYVTRLEKMMKRHRGDPCPYCPMALYYNPIFNYVIIEDGEIRGFGCKSCKICMKLTDKYGAVKCDKSIKYGRCPCNYFKDYFDGRLGIQQREMPEGYMTKVAWKVIRGWKKDNK